MYDVTIKSYSKATWWNMFYSLISISVKYFIMIVSVMIPLKKQHWNKNWLCKKRFFNFIKAQETKNTSLFKKCNNY